MSTNIITTMNGMTKKVYSKKGIINAVPDDAKLLLGTSFTEATQVGEDYNVPVTLTQEHGVTYGGSDDSAVVTLNDSVSAIMKNASIKGFQMIMRARISYKLAMSAVAKGEKAFGSSVGQVLMNLNKSFGRKLEMELIHGQRGIGTTSAASGSSTNVTLTLTAASWAQGIWSGMERAKIDVYNGTDLVNDNAAVVISKVIPASRQLVCTGNSTDVAALVALTATAMDIYPYGAYGNQMLGLMGIANTSSSTLFGINVEDYNLFCPNQYAAGSAALTLKKILEAHELGYLKGLRGNCVALIPVGSFNDLAADESTYRVYDSSYGNGKVARTGFGSLEFVALDGVIKVKAHSMIKGGEAVIYPEDSLVRVGCSDITSDIPGQDSGNVWHGVNDAAAAETRKFADQSIFCYEPGQIVGISGIV